MTAEDKVALGIVGHLVRFGSLISSYGLVTSQIDALKRLVDLVVKQDKSLSSIMEIASKFKSEVITLDEIVDPHSGLIEGNGGMDS